MSQSSQIQDEHECLDTVDTIDIETLVVICARMTKTWFAGTEMHYAHAQKTNQIVRQENFLQEKLHQVAQVSLNMPKIFFILYIFQQGEQSCINDIFGKHKHIPIVSEINKVNAVELKTTIQSLVERMVNLENIFNSKDKIISSLISDLQSLQSQLNLMLRILCFFYFKFSESSLEFLGIHICFTPLLEYTVVQYV